MEANWCPRCNGSKKVNKMVECPNCEGTGIDYFIDSSCVDHVTTRYFPCPICKGSRFVIQEISPCPDCSTLNSDNSDLS